MNLIEKAKLQVEDYRRSTVTHPRPLVVIESPLRGEVPAWVHKRVRPFWERVGREQNRRYALQCMKDALSRGEAPYASHLLFDQRGLLDDANPAERTIGMHAGFAWAAAAELRAVYIDRGISSGMLQGIAHRPYGQAVEFRSLNRPGEKLEPPTAAAALALRQRKPDQ